MSRFSATGFRDELRRLLLLSWPVAVSQLGGMLLGIVDMMMLGRVGAAEVAAATMGNIVLMGSTMPLMGVVLGADPLMSQAHGAGQTERTGLYLQRALLLVPLLAVPIFAVCLASPWVLARLGQPEHLIPLTRTYVLINLPSLPLFLAYQAVRGWLQARELTRPAMWVILAVNVVNAFANWVFIFGNLGAPALGLTGSAIATLVTRSSMVLALVWVVRRWRLHEGAWQPWSRASFDRAGLAEVARLGAPIAVAFAVEMWAFQAASILAGQLGELSLAAHSLVFHVIALVFMVPLGVSIGAATRVGNQVGAGDPLGAQRTAWVGLGVTGAFMLLVTVGFVLGRDHIARVFTDDAALLALCATLFPIAGVFQVCDGVQVICAGILRGMGRTRLPAIAHAIGFYAIGLPTALWLFGRDGRDVTDIWWGLCAGLVVVSGVMLLLVTFQGPSSLVRRRDRAPT